MSWPKSTLTSSIQIMCSSGANQINSQNLKFPKTSTPCTESTLSWSSQSMYGVGEQEANGTKDDFTSQYAVRHS